MKKSHLKKIMSLCSLMTALLFVSCATTKPIPFTANPYRLNADQDRLLCSVGIMSFSLETFIHQNLSYPTVLTDAESLSQNKQETSFVHSILRENGMKVDTMLFDIPGQMMAFTINKSPFEQTFPEPQCTIKQGAEVEDTWLYSYYWPKTADWMETTDILRSVITNKSKQRVIVVDQMLMPQQKTLCLVYIMQYEKGLTTTPDKNFQTIQAWMWNPLKETLLTEQYIRRVFTPISLGAASKRYIEKEFLIDSHKKIKKGLS